MVRLTVAAFMTKALLADLWDDQGRDKRQQAILNNMETRHLHDGAQAFLGGLTLAANPWTKQDSPMRWGLWERGWKEAQLGVQP